MHGAPLIHLAAWRGGLAHGDVEMGGASPISRVGRLRRAWTGGARCACARVACVASRACSIARGSARMPAAVIWSASPRQPAAAGASAAGMIPTSASDLLSPAHRRSAAAPCTRAARGDAVHDRRAQSRRRRRRRARLSRLHQPWLVISRAAGAAAPCPSALAAARAAGAAGGICARVLIDDPSRRSRLLLLLPFVVVGGEPRRRCAKVRDMARASPARCSAAAGATPRGRAWRRRGGGICGGSRRAAANGVARRSSSADRRRCGGAGVGAAEPEACTPLSPRGRAASPRRSRRRTDRACVPPVCLTADFNPFAWTWQ